MMDTGETELQGGAWAQWKRILRRGGSTDAQDTMPTGDDLVREEMGENAERARPGRLGWWLLIIGFGGFVLWAALAPSTMVCRCPASSW